MSPPEPPSPEFLESCEQAGVAPRHLDALWLLHQRWPERGTEAARIAALMEDYGHWRLFELGRAGDTAAARRFEQHWRKAALAFLGKGFTREQVDEFTAAFFARAYDKLRDFPWRRPFGGYLRVLLVNLARDELRWLRRRQEHEHDLGDTNLDEVFAGDSPSPEEATLREEERRQVQAALAELTPTDRHLILECLVEGNSGKELAEALGLKPMALYQRLRRAKKRLREILEGPTGVKFRPVVRKRG